MARAWETLDRFQTEDGTIELRRRADDDFLICVGGRVLMNSRASRSEEALAERACAAITGRAKPHVLIGGLGMAMTLRSALDALPADARVVVAELHPRIEAWCRGPLAGLSRAAVDDPRVSVVIDDVATLIRQAGASAAADTESAAADTESAAATTESAAAETKSTTTRGPFDAILLDLYEGPHSRTDATRDPFYGEAALAQTRRALRPGGVFGVWSEAADVSFEQRLRRAGFAVERHAPGRGGRRHCVILARWGPA